MFHGSVALLGSRRYINRNAYPSSFLCCRMRIKYWCRSQRDFECSIRGLLMTSISNDGITETNIDHGRAAVCEWAAPFWTSGWSLHSFRYVRALQALARRERTFYLRIGRAWCADHDLGRQRRGHAAGNRRQISFAQQTDVRETRNFIRLLRTHIERNTPRNFASAFS